MERVRRHTDRWATRLAIALVLSTAIQIGPVLLALRFVKPHPLDIDMQVRVVEIGLEAPQPGRRVPPPRPPPAQPARPTTQPTEPTPVAPRPAPSSSSQRQTTAPQVASPSGERAEPRVQLSEPQMQLAHPAPHLVPPAEQRLEANAHDAGAPSNTPLPSIASAASDMVAMVPRGALFTLLIRMDRVRMDPNANSVRNILANIPDWDAMLGGTDLDPIRDLDEIVLAAANPMGADGHPPDWFVIAKGVGGSDAAMRRAVEQMVAHDRGASREADDQAAAAPSPVHPPPLDGGIEAPEVANDNARPDAGRRVSSPWHALANGAERIDVERYGARRSFVMLGDGTAAIALPGQVDALMAAWSRRASAMVPQDDPRLSMLIEAEGVRNTISFNTWRGPFPMPTRAALGVYQQRDESGPTGAVELRSEWQYDDHAQADHAREMFEYSRGRWHVMINERLGQQGGLSRLLAGAAAGLLGIDIASLESAIDALQFRAEGNRLVMRADLNDRQVRALLNAASLGGGGER
jgi:hypothetical protein